MNLYRDIFDIKNRSINLCFLFNAIGSSLLMPLALLYLAGTSLSAQEIVYLGTVKFWAHSLFCFFMIPLVCRFDIRRMIIFSLINKLASLALLFFGQSFFVCLLVMMVTGLSTSVFSTAAKFYIRATSTNISESFSVRMTLNNVGAAISPLVISLLVFFEISFTSALLILVILFMVGVLSAVGLEHCARTRSSPATFTKLTGLFSRESIIVATMSIVFAMLYYTFETIVPLELVKADLKSLIGPVMLLNTAIIILGQIPVYRYFTVKFGVTNSLLLSTALCILFFIPYFLLLTDLPGLLLIVFGVTFLEMFYGAGIDTVIASADSEPKIALLDGVSSIALSVGAAIAASIYGHYVMFLPVVITLFVMTYAVIRYKPQNNRL